MTSFQAIILAAGKGKRLQPLTKSVPKPLMKINNRTILDRQIQILIKNGITDIIIVTGYKSQLIKKHLERENLKIIVNRKFKKFNTLYSTWLIKKYIKTDFIFLYGDLIFDEEMISSFLKQKHLASLIIDPNSKNDNHSVIIKNSQIKNINLDRKKEKFSGQFIGICKFTGSSVKIFKESLENFASINNLEGEFVRLIKLLIKKNCQIFAFPITKHRWINVNDEARLELARKEFDVV